MARLTRRLRRVEIVFDGAEYDANALFALLMNPLPAAHVFATTPLPGAWHVGGT